MTDQTTRAGADPAQSAPDTPGTLETALADVAARLGDTLDRAGRLLNICEEHAEAGDSHSVAALQAAARILRGQTEAASALARIVRGESRHRTIVEYANGVGPNGRLNSKFFQEPPPERSDEEARAELKRRLDRLLTPSRRAEEEAEDARIAAEKAKE